jgi:hypothetical protein
MLCLSHVRTGCGGSGVVGSVFKSKNVGGALQSTFFMLEIKLFASGS